MNKKTLDALGALSPYASLAGGIVSGIGSFFGSKSRNDAQLEATRLTNETNRQIARETNEANMNIALRNNNFNREMYEQQNRDQLNFWNMQNTYNDPSKEVERLRSAGLNPAMYYGNGAQAGSIQAASAPTADPSGTQQIGAPMESPDMSQQLSVGEAVSRGLTSAIEQYRGLSEARIAAVNAEYARIRAEKDLEEQAGRIKKGSAEYDTIMENLDFLRSTREDRIIQNQLNTEISKQTLANMREQRLNMESERNTREALAQLQVRIQEFNEKKFKEEQANFEKQLVIMKQNADTMAYNARTGRMDYELRNKEYKRGFNIALNDYCLKLKQLGLEKQKIKQAREIAEKQINKSLFGIVTSLPNRGVQLFKMLSEAPTNGRYSSIFE